MAADRTSSAPSAQTTSASGPGFIYELTLGERMRPYEVPYTIRVLILLYVLTIHLRACSPGARIQLPRYVWFAKRGAGGLRQAAGGATCDG